MLPLGLNLNKRDYAPNLSSFPMLAPNPALLTRGTPGTYFFVELELWHGLVNLIHTEVFEKQET